MGKDPSLDGCVQDGREEKDGAVVCTVAWTLPGLSQINNDIVGLCRVEPRPNGGISLPVEACGEHQSIWCTPVHCMWAKRAGKFKGRHRIVW
jgi:hypothetical protein